MSATRIPAIFCPYCGYNINYSTHVEDEIVEPIEGDFALCGKCTGILVFDKDLKQIKATSEILENAPDDVVIELYKAKAELEEYTNDVKGILSGLKQEWERMKNHKPKKS